ncbi:MAG: hypothetical protein ACOC13_00445 [Tangfeifania sp.]
MKNKKSFPIKTAFLLLIMAVLTGCSDYLDNPLKDKETGDDINLLIIDFNFFNTRLTYKLIDASDGSVITAPATLRFSGENGNDIVTFSGEKKTEFVTTQGQLELTVDPNVEISEDNPFKYAVNVEAEGYNTLTKGFQLNNEGKKTIELRLSKKADEDDSDLDGDVDTENGDTTIVFSSVIASQLKSAEVDKEYEISYSITWNDLLKFKDTNGDLLFNSSEEAWTAYESDPDNFMSISVNTFSDYDPEIDVVYIDGVPESVLFHKLETGNLNEIHVDGREVGDLNGGVISSAASYSGTPTPDIFGFATFNDAWNVSGTDTVYNTSDFSYTLVKASEEELCETGSNITFQSDVTSSFSIDADVYDINDNLLTTINFKGNFPETFQVENTPQKAVKLVFRDNNPAFKPIPTLAIDDFCTGDYTVDVDAQDGYEQYQVVLKAFCPDNPSVAVAPTYSGEFKIAGSSNPWQGVDMAGGVVDLLGLPNQEYQLRLLWENEWEYSTLFTEFNADGSYAHTTGSDNIYSEEIEDGRIRINIEHTFSEDVCIDMGW